MPRQTDENELPGHCSVETLVHFNCPACQKWWSIGDPDRDKTRWFCPWCGTRLFIDLHIVDTNPRPGR